MKNQFNEILPAQNVQVSTSETPRIVAWCVEVKWDDNSTEKLADVPTYVSRNIDAWLDEVEESNKE
jgi:hypothetical protein